MYDPSKDTKSIGIHQCFCYVSTLLSHYVRNYDDNMMQQSFTGMYANSCIEPTTVDNLTNSFVHMTFANTGKPEDEIYPATVFEIASEQRKDKKLKRYFNKHVEVNPKDRISLMVIDETDILLYDRQRLIIPTSMQSNGCLVSSLLNAP